MVTTAPLAITAPVADITAEPAGDAAAAGLTPTIHWEDVQKHADDKISFTPGERATVGFKPRSGDRWNAKKCNSIIQQHLSPFAAKFVKPEANLPDLEDSFSVKSHIPGLHFGMNDWAAT